jgi:hypothetical protein
MAIASFSIAESNATKMEDIVMWSSQKKIIFAQVP